MELVVPQSVLREFVEVGALSITPPKALVPPKPRSSSRITRMLGAPSGAFSLEYGRRRGISRVQGRNGRIPRALQWQLRAIDLCLLLGHGDVGNEARGQ